MIGNRFLVSIVLNCVFLSSYSQTLRGRVTDEKLSPMEFANVVLQTVGDSVMVNGTVTGQDGSFEFPQTVKEGDYLLRVSFIGYGTVVQRCHVPSDTGDIMLKPSSSQLNGVVVKGNAIQNSTTGYKVNVQSLRFAKDRDFMDIMQFMPGVTVQDGKLKVIGNAPSAYYIDGVRVTDLEIIKSLSSDRISTIEVDYMAGAEESSSAIGGVIRIKTRRDLRGGYDGDVRLGATAHPSNGIDSENASSQLSASIGKLYVFNNLRLSNARPKVEEEEGCRSETDATDGYTSLRTGKYMYKNVGEYLGLSYQFDAKNVLKGSASYDYSYAKTEETARSVSRGTETLSRSVSPERLHSVQGVADYAWKPKPGSQLAVIVDYLYRHQDTKQLYYYDDADTQTRQNTHLLRLQSKWQQPLGKAGLLTVGLDYQQTRYSNDLCIRTTMHSYAPAAFATFKGKYKALMFDLGLRVQNTEMKVKDGGVTSSHNDFGVYPTVNLMWMADAKRRHVLNLSYKYNIEDLPYSAISNYKNYTSPYYYVTGNPELTTPLSHQLMLMATLWGKWNIIGGYAYSDNSIYFVTEPSPDDASQTQVKPYNSGYIQVMMLGTEVMFTPFKWLTSKPRIQLKSTRGNVLGTHYSSPAAFTFDWVNDIRFSKTFSAGVYFHYEEEAEHLETTLKEVYNLRLNVSKSFCKESLLLTVDAMPWVKNRVLITETDLIRSVYENKSKNEYLRVSLTWRFSGGKHLREQSTPSNIQNYKVYEREQ